MRRKINRKKLTLNQKFGIEDKFQEGGSLVDPKGFLDSNAENFSPFKIIPSNEITMKGVSQDVIAFPLSEDGQVLGKKLMRPDEEFTFPDATSVLEIPSSEFEKFMAGGELPSFQGGGQSTTSNDLLDLREEFIREQALKANQTTDIVPQQDLLAGRSDFIAGQRNNVSVVPADQLRQSRNDFITDARVNTEVVPQEQLVQGREDFINQALGRTPQQKVETTTAGLAPVGDQRPIEEQIVAPDASEINAGLEANLAAKENADNSNINFDGNVDLFNPFVGVDLGTALFKLGQGIEEGDALDIASAGVKTLTGGARTFLSGLSSQRRNQFVVDRFNEQQRNNLTRNETLQEGGQLTELDVEKINESSEFQFNLETANDLFEKRQPVEAPEKQEANLGRYKDVGYFKVNNIKGDTIVLDTTSRNPHNASSVKQLIRPIEALNPGKKVVINYIPKRQEGGTLTEEDVENINTSSEFQFNLDTANQLFERREPTAPAAKPAPVDLGRFKKVNYFDVVNTNGNEINLKATSKNPHNRDSVKQLIPELRRLNPGKRINIKFQDGGDVSFDFGLEDLDPNNPIFQKGGELNKVLTEGFVKGIENENFKEPNVEVEAGEHIDRQGEPVKEVIGKKHSEGGEDMQLDEGDRIISDHLKVGGENAKTLRRMLELKVKAGDTYATVLDKYKTKSGLAKILKEKEEIIKQIDKQNNISDESTAGLNLQFLSKKLNELEEQQKPLDVQQKEVFNEVFALQEASKPAEERAESEQEETFQLGGSVFNSDQIVKMGSQFDLSPEDSINLFQAFKKGGKVLPMAQDGNNPEFGGKGSGLGFVPEGQSRNQSTGLFGSVDQAAFEETRLKNPWFDWRNFDPNNPQDVLRFQRKFNQLSTDGQQIREDGKFGEQTQSVQLPFTQTRGIVTGDTTITADIPDNIPAPSNGVPDTPAEQATQEVEQENPVDRSGSRLDVVLLPDQTPLPPDALQPHLKNQRRFDRIDPNLISPEQQIEEINRTKNQTIKEINKLPDSRRRAALASLNANVNNQINSAIQQTNRFNSQVKTQADQINLQQSNAEENFLATDALDFERRQLTALAKTQNDIRNFFNQLNRIQVGNFNTINNLNLLNDLNDDFQFTGSGIEKTTPNPVFTDNPAVLRTLQRTGVVSAPQQTKKKGGTYKKKRGRKRK